MDTMTEEFNKNENTSEVEIAQEDDFTGNKYAVKYISPHVLKQSPLNYRVYLSAAEVEDLISSIREVRQILVPLLVNEKMEVIAGNRRLVAATTLNLSLVPVIFIHTKDDLDVFEKIIHANISRKRTCLIIAQEARTLQELIIAKKRNGTFEEFKTKHPQKFKGKKKWDSLIYISGLVKMPPSSLRKLLYVLKTDLRLFSDLDAGKISLDKAFKKIESQCVTMKSEKPYKTITTFCPHCERTHKKKVSKDSSESDYEKEEEVEYLEPVMPTFDVKDTSEELNEIKIVSEQINNENAKVAIAQLAVPIQRETDQVEGSIEAVAEEVNTEVVGENAIDPVVQLENILNETSNNSNNDNPNS